MRKAWPFPQTIRTETLRLEPLPHSFPPSVNRGSVAASRRTNPERNREEMATPLHIAGVQVNGLLKAEGGRAEVRQRMGSNADRPRSWPEEETRRRGVPDEALFLDRQNVNRLDDELDGVADFEVKILN